MPEFVVFEEWLNAVDMEDYCDNDTGTKKDALRSKLEDRLNISMKKATVAAKPKAKMKIGLGK